jgi:hypothetical protein
LMSLPDAAWDDYERDGNVKGLATKHALFFRSVFVPSLALSLKEARNPERCRIFADDFEIQLIRRLMSEPAPLHSFVQTMVMVKQS